MSIAVIDYGSGNLTSAAKAVERAAHELGLAATVTVTADPAVIADASHIVLPGQGAFSECRRGLAAVPGLEAALQEAVIARGRPFFGICVGMQLLAREGHEHGTHAGLGWIDGVVEPLELSDKTLKIPHMGWNDLIVDQPTHPVLAGVRTGDHVYFVHSYEFVPASPGDCLAHADYGGPVTAMVARANLVGTQFHPEKSQAVGLRLIANFLKWRP
ncbi:MAG: imidazole glycerol phosphate synthase subunit HisH [Proteobacteria bacterium]|nr:imidazole glycerol phosphate synthase subunit HisH [Pseudomonadota bacterium]